MFSLTRIYNSREMDGGLVSLSHWHGNWELMLFLVLITQSCTVMRSEQTQKFKVKLHVLKQTPTGMQVLKNTPCCYDSWNKVRRSTDTVFTGTVFMCLFWYDCSCFWVDFSPLRRLMLLLKNG